MRKLSLICLSLLMAVQLSAAPADTLLFHTDFSTLPPGKFAQWDSPGFPEYHHVPMKFMGAWELVNNRTPDEWYVFEHEGGKVLDYMGYNATMWTKGFIYPILVTGDPLWKDYTLEADISPLSDKDMSGIVFNYQDGRHYSVFAFGPGDTLSLRHRDGEKAFRKDGWKILGTSTLKLDKTRPYTFRVETAEDRIRCYVDGAKIFDVKDSRFSGGKVGLIPQAPVRYHSVSVTTTRAAKKKFDSAVCTRQAELDSLRRDNPRPVLWKRIKTEDFGVARALRLGDLDGDGRTDFLLVQNLAYLGRNYNRISCMTALDADGHTLWQVGTPNPDHAWLTYDVAVQIHDFDGDGQMEVIYADERWIKVLDGKTGKLVQKHIVPESKILPEETSWEEYEHYYRRDHLHFLNVDCFSFCDLRGTGKPLDFIIKDRHTRLWAYDNQFNLLWTASANLGHYPYFYDYDDDGRDEVFLGYTIFDDDGKIIWSLDDKLQEHADGIVAGDFSLGTGEKRVFITASDDGVAVADMDGKILLHDRVGHAQTPSVGQFRPDIPGLELCNINFWGEPGLITLYNSQGDKITDFELIHQGSPILPVNWRGDGTELILLSTNKVDGGMVDGWGRRAVMFPADGHPDLSCLVHDLTGDARDEIITWDPEWIYIYTQSDAFEGDSIYAPVRPPAYNESNYRPEVSWPAWKKN